MGSVSVDGGFRCIITNAFSAVFSDVCNASKATNAKNATKAKGSMRSPIIMEVANAVQTTHKRTNTAYNAV